jgi:nucleoside-diphosphate-sugar epimerase
VYEDPPPCQGSSSPAPPASSAALAFARVRQALPGDDDVNPFAVRYMLRRGTCSITKAPAVLGYAPAVGLEEGLARTVQWLQAR